MSLPHRLSDFDPETAPRYHPLKRRLQETEEAFDLIAFHRVELTKPLAGLAPEQHAWLTYLTTDFKLSDGGDQMNQRDPQQEPQRQRYQIPPGVSEETRRCIEQAQARLDLFAAKPEYRSAYEREVLEMMEHNTQLENSFEEGLAEGEARGRVETIKASIKGLRAIGLDDHAITTALNLTPEEASLYLA